MYHLYRERSFEKIGFRLTGHPNSGTVEYEDVEVLEVSGSRYIYGERKMYPCEK